MRSRRTLALVLLVTLALGGSVGAGTAVSGPDTGASAPSERGVAAQPADPTTEIRINLTTDGDARWSVSTTFVLENESDVAAFESFAEDLGDPATGDRLGYSADTFSAFVREASNATGRSMSLQNPTWSHRVKNETGVVTLSFTWTNFAAVEGNEVRLGDVFTGEDGTWFPELTADQRLEINAPPEYAIDSLSFSPSPSTITDASLSVAGPAQIDGQNVSIVYVPVDSRTTTTSTSTPGDDESGGIPLTMIGGGLLVVLVIVLVGYQFRDAFDSAAGSGASTDGGNGGGGAGAAAENADTDTGAPATESDAPEAGGAAGETTGPTGGGSDGTAAGQTTVNGAGDAAAGEAAASGESDDGAGDSEDDQQTGDEEEVDVELLSDEERVERLLDENGGRMKQADIVTETGWSNAKVSQLLSAMDEDDRIDKLRIGRENLITLPEEDVGEIE